MPSDRSSSVNVETSVFLKNWLLQEGWALHACLCSLEDSCISLLLSGLGRGGQGRGGTMRRGAQWTDALAGVGCSALSSCRLKQDVSEILPNSVYIRYFYRCPSPERQPQLTERLFHPPLDDSHAWGKTSSSTYWWPAKAAVRGAGEHFDFPRQLPKTLAQAIVSAEIHWLSALWNVFSHSL